jgi:site-specific recombinase XerC
MSLLENGTDIHKIQKALGHNSPKTTEIYARMNNKVIQQTESPLEQIVREKAMMGANHQQLLTV